MAWYGAMCNPRALHPALYDSAIVEGDISEADLWYGKTHRCIVVTIGIRAPCSTSLARSSFAPNGNRFCINLSNTFSILKYPFYKYSLEWAVLPLMHLAR